MGPFPIKGTIGGYTFYEVNGQFFVRAKSSLTGERWRKDPRFARSRENSKEFGGGSTVGSAIWHAVPRELRKRLGRSGFNRLRVACAKVILAGDVETMWLKPGQRILELNRDPDLAKIRADKGIRKQYTEEKKKRLQAREDLAGGASN